MLVHRDVKEMGEVQIPLLSAFSEHNGLMDCDQMTGRCTRTGIKFTNVRVELNNEALSLMGIKIVQSTKGLSTSQSERYTQPQLE